MPAAAMQSYYFAHSLLLLLFAPLRAYFLHHTPNGSPYGKMHSVPEFLTWEKQVVVTLAAAYAWKALRRRSWEHFAQDCFFWGKVVTLLTAMAVDVRLAVWYALLCWGAYAAFPQPMFMMTGVPGREAIMHLTPVVMKEEVLRSDSASWLVLFYTEQHAESIAMAPVFAELADKFSSDKLRFGIMDACLFPRCAAECKVAATTWSAQLPAVVKFVKGKEVGRIPTAAAVEDWWSWTGGVKRNYYTRADVLRKFDLKPKADAPLPAAAGAPLALASKQRQ